MRYFTFLLLVGFLQQSGRAQTSRYFPMPDANVVWNTRSDFHCFISNGSAVSDRSILYDGDTLINNLIYHRLSSPAVHNYYIAPCSGGNSGYSPGLYYGAIRQDTILHKVFIIPADSSNEVILYDFSLQVGDTVTGYLEVTYPGVKDIVLSIDSFLIDGFYHRALYINSLYNIYYIEGVGSSFGLLVPSPGYVSDFGIYSILCMKVNGTTIFPIGQSSCNMILGTPEFQQEKANWIFPNPASNEFTIKSSVLNQIQTLEMVDFHGKTVFRKDFDNLFQYTWQRENLASGIYVIKVHLKNGIIKVQKFSLN
ncbi:MAG: T9SS type A sorting domain-containing protein [Bacteroidetes bacterium]|nr:T9SS type A sorting domain-containing protein [Bacteroidota bacterium]